MEDRLVWIDLETTGLNPQEELIVEVGFLITDLNLTQLRGFNQLIWSEEHDNRLAELRTSRDKDDQFVVDMHDKSGLWMDAAAKGNPIEDVIDHAVAWLRGVGVSTEDPMCGSSVHFDRSFLEEHMVEVFDLFSYRNIDVSSVKELCKRYNPQIYSQLDSAYPNPLKRHRVIPDIQDTVAEFQYYRDEFLFWKD